MFKFNDNEYHKLTGIILFLQELLDEPVEPTREILQRELQGFRQQRQRMIQKNFEKGGRGE